MASPSTVISLGYGSWGSVNLLPTLGYGIESPGVTDVDPFIFGPIRQVIHAPVRRVIYAPERQTIIAPEQHMPTQSLQRYPYALGLLSIEPVGISFEDMLPTGRTVASCTADLINPAGVSTSVAANQISVVTPNVTITIGPFATAGTWKLKPVATCSGSSPPSVPKLEMEIDIEVSF